MAPDVSNVELLVCLAGQSFDQINWASQLHWKIFGYKITSVRTNQERRPKYEKVEYLLVIISGKIENNHNKIRGNGRCKYAHHHCQYPILSIVIKTSSVTWEDFYTKIIIDMVWNAESFLVNVIIPFLSSKTISNLSVNGRALTYRLYRKN